MWDTGRTEINAVCGFGCPESHGHGSASTGCSRDGQRGTGPSCKAKVRGMCKSLGWGTALGRASPAPLPGVCFSEPAVKSTCHSKQPHIACPAALLCLHVPAGCRWTGWEQARSRLSCWEPGTLCPALGQLTSKANLEHLAVCCRQSCSITLIL